MKNNKQIPFRYPEELEKDFEEICGNGYWKLTKNRALIKAIKNTAELKRILKTFTSKNYYNQDSPASIENLIERLEKISQHRGKKEMERLNLSKTDIRKKDPEK
jgi:hypothetical protein